MCFRRMSERYPDARSKCTDVKFQDSRVRRGQRNTPVTLEQYPDVGTKCSHEVFRRLLVSGSVPKCEEVSQNLIAANCGHQVSHGGARKPALVATAQEATPTPVCLAMARGNLCGVHHANERLQILRRADEMPLVWHTPRI